VNMDNRDAVRLKANNFDSEHGCGSIGRCSTCMADFAIKIRDEALATYKKEVTAAIEKAEVFEDIPKYLSNSYMDGWQDALLALRDHLGQGEKESE
jgi:hypothetical protein